MLASSTDETKEHTSWKNTDRHHPVSATRRYGPFVATSKVITLASSSSFSRCGIKKYPLLNRCRHIIIGTTWSIEIIVLLAAAWKHLADKSEQITAASIQLSKKPNPSILLQARDNAFSHLPPNDLILTTMFIWIIAYLIAPVLKNSRMSFKKHFCFFITSPPGLDTLKPEWNSCWYRFKISQYSSINQQHKQKHQHQ